jgi:hypothetical protein
MGTGAETTTPSMGAWYHGGDLHGGTPKGTYLYVTPQPWHARGHAKQGHADYPERACRVYRLCKEHNHLVGRHRDGIRTVVLQSDLLKLGGALSVFEVFEEVT